MCNVFPFKYLHCRRLKAWHSGRRSVLASLTTCLLLLLPSAASHSGKPVSRSPRPGRPPLCGRESKHGPPLRLGPTRGRRTGWVQPTGNGFCGSNLERARQSCGNGGHRRRLWQPVPPGDHLFLGLALLPLRILIALQQSHLSSKPKSVSGACRDVSCLSPAGRARPQLGFSALSLEQ